MFCSRQGSQSSAPLSFGAGAAAELRETVSVVTRTIEELPSADNAAGAVEKKLRANALLRNQ